MQLWQMRYGSGLGSWGHSSSPCNYLQRSPQNARLVENREYVVEKLPYSNVPVYVVCPRDGEGHSWTLLRNYLLPISPNLEQSKLDKPVAGVGNDTSPTPVPPVSHAPVEAELLGMVASSSTGSTLQNSPDQPAPLWCSTWTTRNQLPLRYQDMVK